MHKSGKLILLLIPATTIIVSCGGGGGGSNGGGDDPQKSIYPIGYCIESGSQAIATPAIIPDVTKLAIIHTYSNDGSFQSGNAIKLAYAELALLPQSLTADYLLNAANYSATLPAGVCAMSPATVNNTYLPDSTMYWSNCTASVANGILTFNSSYSIYAQASAPGSGTALQSGVYNFSCSFKTY